MAPLELNLSEIHSCIMNKMYKIVHGGILIGSNWKQKVSSTDWTNQALVYFPRGKEQIKSLALEAGKSEFQGQPQLQREFKDSLTCKRTYPMR